MVFNPVPHPGACCLAGPALAGEGGVTHVIPGATATLSDLPPTSPGWFLKPMYLNYKGSFSAQLPTAAGLAGNVDATTNTVALVGGYTFGQTFLGGAHYTFAAALPYILGGHLGQSCKRPVEPRGSRIASPASAT